MKENFDRIEKKYILDGKTAERFASLISGYMEADKFYKTKISSIYYDTPTFELIRRSIEKPNYKEKLRIRAYGEPLPDEYVYVEMKRKLNGHVYKRRAKAQYQKLLQDISSADMSDNQIKSELNYFLSCYEGLKPMIYITYLRTAFIGKTDRSLRITLDDHLLYRTENLSLFPDKKDKPIIDGVILEIKVQGAMPLWLTEILDKLKIKPTSFSKVGRAYGKIMEETK